MSTTTSTPEIDAALREAFPDESTWGERNGMSRSCTFDDCGACESSTCECSCHIAGETILPLPKGEVRFPDTEEGQKHE